MFRIYSTLIELLIFVIAFATTIFMGIPVIFNHVLIFYAFGSLIGCIVENVRLMRIG